MLCFGVLATLFTVPILSALQKSELTLCRLRPGDLRLTDCQFLYLDQRHPESRDVPGSGSRAWVGLSYAVANALFGGSAEYVALSLKSAGIEQRSIGM
ncbi:alpha-ketoglutarate transporter [Klebsiella pneumoniae]|uniref:Alpha-ketoglutarate transporter n=1 Tax=Klebsiella pneumoniae TaxID=573 RepID=A0A378FVB1_KLEPN|nr:alpha-ketoglutarate transporter [Klebsiella pneumoniae]